MTLTALVKLSDRFGEAFFPRIAAMLAPYKTSCQLQAQQRACEYSELLREPYAGIREQLLDRMPPLDIDNAKARRADDAAGDSEDDDSEEASEEEAPRAARATKPAETSLMDDLLGLDGRGEVCGRRPAGRRPRGRDGHLQRGPRGTDDTARTGCTAESAGHAESGGGGSVQFRGDAGDAAGVAVRHSGRGECGSGEGGRGW